jgi:arylsulfatase A-like enzyme
MNIPLGGLGADYGAYPEKDEQMGDYKVALWAADKLKNGMREPFFISAGFVRPHTPFICPSKWFDLHPLDKIHWNADDALPAEGLSPFAQDAIYTNYDWWNWIKENNKQKEVNQAYLACISFADHCVGTVLDALSKSGYADNTYVVLWSDNGWHNGEKGLYEKRTLWDETDRIPFIIAGPGIEGGRLCDRTVGLIDIYPTLIELCGLPKKEGLEGKSLVPLLKGVDEKWNDRPVLTTKGPGIHAVRTQKWTYIHYRDGYQELYDNAKDQIQRNNLAGNPDFSQIIKKLRTHMPEVDKAPVTKGMTAIQAQTYKVLKSNYEKAGFNIDEDFVKSKNK